MDVDSRLVELYGPVNAKRAAAAFRVQGRGYMEKFLRAVGMSGRVAGGGGESQSESESKDKEMIRALSDNDVVVTKWSIWRQIAKLFRLLTCGPKLLLKSLFRLRDTLIGRLRENALAIPALPLMEMVHAMRMKKDISPIRRAWMYTVQGIVQDFKDHATMTMETMGIIRDAVILSIMSGLAVFMVFDGHGWQNDTFLATAAGAFVVNLPSIVSCMVWACSAACTFLGRTFSVVFLGFISIGVVIMRMCVTLYNAVTAISTGGEKSAMDDGFAEKILPIKRDHAERARRRAKGLPMRARTPELYMARRGTPQ